MKACAGSDAGLVIAEDIPGEPDARLGKEKCAVVGKCVGLHVGYGVDDIVVEGVDASATLGLAPSGRRFGAECRREFRRRGTMRSVSSR